MSDINNQALYDEPMTYDPTAELNPTQKIPDGWYLMELGLRKEATLKPIGQQPCVEANVMGTIIAPGDKINGFRVSDFISSYIFESSGTSTLHRLLTAVGNPAPATQSARQLQAQVDSTFQQPGQGRARIRWEASVKNSDGATPAYLRVRGMKHFPQNPDGSYSPFVDFTLGDGTVVNVEAKEKFVDFKPANAGQVAASN
jgi:hypothetical protein